MPKTTKKEKDTRLKVSSQFVPGTKIDATTGNTLDIVALGFDTGELYGVDLASRAFVRVETQEHGQQVDHDDVSDRENKIRRHRLGGVYRLVVGQQEPIDAGRPEGLGADEPMTRIGSVTRRGMRRLCTQVLFGEHPGSLVLGSRARSLSYADLSSSNPSMMLIALSPKSCRIYAEGSGRTLLTFVWGGLEQSIVVHDPRVCAIARAHQGQSLQKEDLKRALGFKIGFALFGYARVKDRYVEKVVISLLGN